MNFNLIQFPENDSALASLRDAQEDAFRRDISEALAICLRKNARFVFLAGPSCSGKTTSSQRLIRSFEKAGRRVFTFSTDDFFFDEADAELDENGIPDYDAFSHTDSEYLCRVIGALSAGKPARIPYFDFAAKRRGAETTLLDPRNYDVFIIEGIHALNDLILSAVPSDTAFSAFYITMTKGVSTFDGVALSPIDLRFCRRLARDARHRFADAERTYLLWEKVLPSEKTILLPFQKNADAFIHSDFGYESAVLKDECIRLLEGVALQSPYKQKADELRQKLIRFPSLDKEFVPTESVLQEFIR